jgi:hypothetical protein
MMSDLHVAQLTSGLFVAATPWIVVRIALAVASRLAHGAGRRIAPPAAFVRLQRATPPALLVIAGLALWLPAPSGWMAVIDGLAFAALAAVALRALHDLDSATRAARHVDSTTRVASLVARRSDQYLPTYWRVLLFGATITGFALFAWRVAVPSPVDRRLFVPVAFAFIAPVFLWLYEVWIHRLVTGPTVADTEDVDLKRRRSIRMVFGAEFILVTGFLALAHGVLDLDWSQSGAWAALALTSGGVLGVLGCALALASDLSTRSYLAVDVDRHA